MATRRKRDPELAEAQKRMEAARLKITLTFLVDSMTDVQVRKLLRWTLQDWVGRVLLRTKP